jgi:cell division protein FtsB
MSALTAIGHVDQALLNAKHGRIDKAVVLDLEKAKAALQRSMLHAEQTRRRLIRKANTLDQEMRASSHDTAMGANAG